MPQAPGLAPSLWPTATASPTSISNVQPVQYAQAPPVRLWSPDPLYVQPEDLPAANPPLMASNPPLSGPLIAGGGLLGLGLGALILNNQKKDLPADMPPLPEELIGNNPREAGNRSNTDMPGVNPTPEELFDKLTGGRSETLPDGTRKGPNNVRLRPDVGEGPRLNIPANGKKPHETIHFPGSKP
jgi:hypothetical protein